MRLALLVVVLCVSVRADFCELLPTTSSLFLQPGEQQLLALRRIVRGSGLTYTSSSPYVNVIPHVSLISEKPHTGLGSKLLNLQLSGQITALLRYLSETQVSVQLLKQENTSSAPITLSEMKIDFQAPTRCFGAYLVDKDSDVVLDCQTVSKDVEDVLCLLLFSKPDGNRSKCNRIPSVSQQSNRKGRIITFEDQSFFTTANKNPDWLGIYSISQNGLDFTDIADSNTLQTGPLSIADFDIDINSRILIADGLNNRLIRFRYNPGNRFGAIDAQKIKMNPTAIACASDGNIYVSFDNSIITYDPLWRLLYSYQKQPADSTELVVTDNFLISMTSNSINIYRKDSGSLNDLLAHIDRTDSSLYGVTGFAGIIEYTLTSSKLYRISEGFLQAKVPDALTKVTITALSGSLRCPFIVTLSQINAGTTDVITKKKLNLSELKVKELQITKINLKDYYGGPSLEFSVDFSSQANAGELRTVQPLSVGAATLNATESMNFTNVLFGCERQLILSTSETEFYQLSACSVAQSAKCRSLNNVQCQIIDSRNLQIPASLLTGRILPDGTPVMVWVDSDKNKVNILNLVTRQVKSFTTLSQFLFSSVVMNDVYIFLTCNYGRYITIYNYADPSVRTITIDKDTFSSSSFSDGFYPRELLLNPSNNGQFFIQLPLEIASVAIRGDSVLLLGILSYSDEFQLSDEVKVVIGHSTMVVMDLAGIKEFSLLSGIKEPLHQKPILTDLKPVYCQKTDSLVIRTTDGSLLWMKLNQPYVDQILLQLPYSKQFAFDGGWLVLQKLETAYRLVEEPSVSFVTQNSAKLSYGVKLSQDFKLQIQVAANKGTPISAAVKIVSVSYPTALTDIPPKDAGLLLPVSGGETYPIDMSTFFSGNAVNYKLLLDVESIQLLQPFRGQVTSPLSANSILIVATQTRLYSLTSDNTLITLNRLLKILNTTVIPEKKKCTLAALDDSSSLLVVLCWDNSFSTIHAYSVSDLGDLGYLGSRELPSGAKVVSPAVLKTIILNGQPIMVILEASTLSSPIVYDSFITIMAWYSDRLQLLGRFNSESFGSDDILAINSMYWDGTVLMATVADMGIAFALTNVRENGVNLNNAQILNLQEQILLEQYILTSSYFVEVEVLEITDQNYQVFVSSSNAKHFILSLSLDDTVLVVDFVNEGFNAYGSLSTLNWHTVLPKWVFVAYYDDVAAQISLVGYPRQPGLTTNISTAITWPLDPQQLSRGLAVLEPEYAYLSNNEQLLRFNFTGSFDLKLIYDAPPTINIITVVARNKYSQASHEVSVRFGDGGSGGVQWYIIMIIILGLMIAIGVGGGLYVRKQREKTKKKMSLMTENEQIDEKI